MQCAGMIGFMLLFGIIASSIWTRLYKNYIQENIKIFYIKSVLFFFALLYFTTSVLKVYLGEDEFTLLESFWDVTNKTYLHYSCVYAVISIIVPLMIKCFLSKYGYQMIQEFDSTYVIVVAVCWFLLFRIDNRTYCILYLFCLLIGGISTFINHKQFEYVRKADIKTVFEEILSLTSFWIVMTGIYLPNELFINNINGFEGNYPAFLLITLAGSVAELLFSIILFLLFVKKI